MDYMDNVYRYDGKIYCEKDLSIELGDEWGGELYKLSFLLEESGKLDVRTMLLVSVGGCDEREFEYAEEALDYYAEELGLEVIDRREDGKEE